MAATTDAERQDAVAPSLARKLREAELAVQLDHQLSKDEILARYLDLVYFGHGAYGVDAAAQAYFGTTSAALTVPQAALLAGMVQSPTAFDPVQHPDAAKTRRDVVIEQLRQQGAISAPTRPPPQQPPLAWSRGRLCPDRAAPPRATRATSAPTSCSTSTRPASPPSSCGAAATPSAPPSTRTRWRPRRPPWTDTCRRARRTSRTCWPSSRRELTRTTSRPWQPTGPTATRQGSPATGCRSCRRTSARARSTRSSRRPRPCRRAWPGSTR